MPSSTSSSSPQVSFRSDSIIFILCTHIDLQHDTSPLARSIKVLTPTPSAPFMCPLLSDPNTPFSDCFTDPPEGKANPRYWGYVEPPTVSVRPLIIIECRHRQAYATIELKGL
jgi:hypothetical protein